MFPRSLDVLLHELAVKVRAQRVIDEAPLVLALALGAVLEDHIVVPASLHLEARRAALAAACVQQRIPREDVLHANLCDQALALLELPSKVLALQVIGGALAGLSAKRWEGKSRDEYCLESELRLFSPRDVPPFAGSKVGRAAVVMMVVGT
ncbi:hypothetical protein TYRP_007009 [Tyrophagus putrescentiae]|nr:hypothetical protein TYRP_007009 [Tyrophagus putrescentiae]